MTVFLAIAKKFLIHEIQEIRNQSIQADASLTNSALSLFGKGRDKKLSQEKREIADALWPEIQSLKDAQTDKETLACIKELLDNAKKEAAVKSKEKHYDEGTFGPAMTKVINFIDEIYAKLEAERMIDIPFDDDPFHKYCYFSAYYIVQKIDDKRNETTVNYLMQHPKITNIRQLAESKEQLLLQKLGECRMDLDTLDKEHPDYQNTRRKWVCSSIEGLLRENKDLCKGHGIKWDIPLSVTFIGSVNLGFPTLRPDNGFMESCMNEAIQQIKASGQQQTASASLAV